MDNATIGELPQRKENYMDGETNGKLPQREMNDEAIEVFKAFMRKVEADNGGDKGKCWECPSDGKALPAGYSISRNADGYGQFTLSEIIESGKKLVRQKTIGAHRLSYLLFKFDMETHKAVLKELYPDIFRQGDVGVERARDIGDKDHVRHYQCANPSCINWHHLELGDHILNMLDRDIASNISNPLSEKAAQCRQEVIDLWNAGAVSWPFAEIKVKTGVKPWEAYRILKDAGIPIEPFIKQLRHSGKVSPAEVEGRKIMAAAEKKK
jgi:hypothetical protein